MDSFAGKTAVVYSRVLKEIPISYENHMAPMLNWCRKNGVFVLCDFTDDVAHDGRFGWKECLNYAFKWDVDLIVVDSIRFVGNGDLEIYNFIQNLKISHKTLIEVRDDDARVCDSLADCIPPETLKSSIENVSPLSGMDADPVSDDPFIDDEDDVVDVEPEVEKTEDTITFVFNVPKGVREFTIRIREVDE